MKFERIGIEKLVKRNKKLSAERSFGFFKSFYEAFEAKLLSEVESCPDFSLGETGKDASRREHFIFIRLYDPVYKPLSVTSLLKKGQELTNVSNINTSHAAIGFDLSDRFYGLSFGGKYSLKIEQCTDVNTCHYMSTCEPDKSFQYTFALPVSEEELEVAKRMTMEYYKSKNLKYTVVHNIPMSIFCIRRKFFASETRVIDFNQTLELFKADFNYNHRIKFKEKFVCSTFCAFILMLSVPSVAKYFNDRSISFNYVTPSDIASIPRIRLLFSSNWTDFKRCAAEFASKNPEFKAYL